MSAAKIKGSLLEYIVRRLLTNCGFARVTPDGNYVFESRGLNFLQGKGAAHDADVLMTPPIQMPFSYPYRINFECKAYNKKIGLAVIRNALGLRYDVNEFEIITEHHLRLRRNNRRAQLAIADRIRYNYQIGVASVSDFSKDAFEFAANNKIPLISLKWILPQNICNLFHEITDNYVRDNFRGAEQEILDCLKGNHPRETYWLDENESHIKTIIDALKEVEKKVVIGLLESGDMVFLTSSVDINFERFNTQDEEFTARYYFREEEDIDKWTIQISNGLELSFRLPQSVIRLWSNLNYNSDAAINIKQEYFARLFIYFTSGVRPRFKVIGIDRDWINRIQSREN